MHCSAQGNYGLPAIQDTKHRQSARSALGSGRGIGRWLELALYDMGRQSDDARAMLSSVCLPGSSLPYLYVNYSSHDL